MSMIAGRIFSLMFILINDITSFKQTILFSVHFFKYLLFYYFWMIMSMKKASNLLIANVQPQGVA